MMVSSTIDVFAGLAVADDELTLAAADRDHRVDGLQAGLHRLGRRLALDDAGALNSAGRVSVVAIAPLPSSGLPGRADRRCVRASRHRPGSRRNDRALDRVALGDLLPLAEQHGADVVGLEVQRQPGHAVGQLEHLERHAVLQAVQACDAVSDGQHGADLGQLRRSRAEPLDAALEDAVISSGLICMSFLESLSCLSRSAGLLARPVRRREPPPACAAARVGCGSRRRGSSCRRER